MSLLINKVLLTIFFLLKSPVHSISTQRLLFVSMNFIFHTGCFIYVADCVFEAKVQTTGPHVPILLVNFLVVKVCSAELLTL